MVYSVVYRKRANQDLERIAAFIEVDNSAKAIEWVNYLRESANSLTDKPYRITPYEGKHRQLVLKQGYGIYYWISETNKMVYITRVYGKGQLRGK